jgi:hypothetical protein
LFKNNDKRLFDNIFRLIGRLQICIEGYRRILMEIQNVYIHNSRANYKSAAAAYGSQRGKLCIRKLDCRLPQTTEWEENFSENFSGVHSPLMTAAG